MKVLYFLILLGCSPILALSQEYTISGYLEDASSGEKLIGVNVYDLISGDGTTTNAYGFYSLTLPKGAVEIVYSYVGYESGIEKFNLKKNTALNVALLEGKTISEVTITAEKSEKKYERTQMSTVTIPVDQIKKVPALLGEVDVLKAMQLLPGVQSGGEGQSGLYVRGGSPDQNLVLLDGVPVYNVSHLFGFFSVFNADAIKDVKLIKGGFPARYGGRLSSVLDIKMKEGNNQGFHGSASIGLISSKLTFEGPIWKDRTSFIVSGRRTYIDKIAQPLIQKSFRDDGREGTAGYYFYDLNAKLNHKFSDKDKLYLSLYTGDDKFYFNVREQGEFGSVVSNDLKWGNLTGAARWNHQWSPKLFSNTTLTYSKYLFGVGAEVGFRSDGKDNTSGLNYGSGIYDYAAGIDFDYVPNSDHFIRFGGKIINHTFKPGKFTLNITLNGKDVRRDTIGQQDIAANEAFLYVEDDYQITDDLKANVGLHFSAFAVNKKTYTSLQPRVGLRYIIGDGMSLKGSFATMEQYINLLTFDGVGLPTDLWLPATDRVAPQKSWQTGIGIVKSFDTGYEVSVEAYYKRMKNLISYKPGEGIFSLAEWQDRVTQGDGESYGVEFFVQKKLGRLTGWVGYTLSYSNRTFEELNFGKTFDYKYDRRHDISIVGSYQLTKKFDIGATWVYGTGNAITLGESTYRNVYGDIGSYNIPYNATEITQRNNFRMGAYHRLDIGINRVSKRGALTHTFSFGAYNTYNRKNPFFLFVDQKVQPTDQGFKVKRVLTQSSLFPIIPYLNYKIEF